MPNTQHEQTKHDQYNISKRHGYTNQCLLWAKKAAIRWLGPTAWHSCDDSCNHHETCEKCIHFVPGNEDSEILTSPESCKRYPQSQ